MPEYGCLQGEVFALSKTCYYHSLWIDIASYHSIFELLPEQFAVPVTLAKDILGIELWYLWDEVTGEWRKLHNEELNVLYSSLNIVRVIKSRRMTWSPHVAHMGEGRGVYRVLVGKPGEREHWGDHA